MEYWSNFNENEYNTVLDYKQTIDANTSDSYSNSYDIIDITPLKITVSNIDSDLGSLKTSMKKYDDRTKKLEKVSSMLIQQTKDVTNLFHNRTESIDNSVKITEVSLNLKIIDCQRKINTVQDYIEALLSLPWYKRFTNNQKRKIYESIVQKQNNETLNELNKLTKQLKTLEKMPENIETNILKKDGN